MEVFRMTLWEKEAFDKTMSQCRARMTQASKDKTASGSDMDGWHDELFKINMESEAQAIQMLRQLQVVAANIEVVEPAEQVDIVELGNAVVIDFEDGEDPETYVVVGYLMGEHHNSITLKSPLGQVLLGAKLGEKKTYSANGNSLSVTIKRIILPSIAKELFQNGER